MGGNQRKVSEALCNKAIFEIKSVTEKHGKEIIKNSDMISNQKITLSNVKEMISYLAKEQ